MMEIAGNILKVTRAKDWRLSFVPFIIGCVYCWLWWFQISLSVESVLLFVLSFVTTFGFAAFGYFINEFFDKKADAKAGKINKLSVLPASYQLLLFIGCATITFLPWYWLPADKITVVLIAAEIFFFFIYSLPFPRLKNVPLVSGFIDSGYAYVLPLLLSFHTYSLFVKSAHNEMIYFFAGAVFFIGFRNITIHHVNDIFKDMRSQTLTLPQVIGVNATNTLIIVLMAEEILLLLLWSAIVTIQHPFFAVWIIIFITAIVLRYRIAIQNFRFDFISIEPVRHLTDPIYQYVFPAFSLLLAMDADYKWLLLLPLHIVLFLTRSMLLIMWDKLFWGSLEFKYFFINRVIVTIRIAGNYAIYYGFLMVGINLRKENLSAWSYIKKRMK